MLDKGDREEKRRAFCRNWGGSYWTGGQTRPYESLTPQEQAALAAPIDSMDALFQEHDLAFSAARVRRDSVLNNRSSTEKQRKAAECQYQRDVKAADQRLGQQLDALDDNPANWARPAPNIDTASTALRQARWYF